MTARLRIFPFSLKDTLECGQFFRYTRVMDTYLVQSSDHLFSVWQEGESLFYEGVDEDFLVHFFRFDEDLDAILKQINRDPFIHQTIREYRGLRLIRQDPWECLLSFLCSPAKSIPHIRCIVESLCRISGKRIAFGTFLGYGFPEPACIRNEVQLESVRAGFRAGYLVNASRCINRHQLLALRGLPYREARQRLMSVRGVGKKVADCTLLYSLDFLEAFPIDTWIKRGLEKVYFKGKRTGEKKMEEFVSNHFGPFAGYAQLYLYHYWRNHPPWKGSNSNFETNPGVRNQNVLKKERS
ncbi:MAG: DNA-3-methyladenine glycosylase family protein [Thermodesulfobacteriota bacterium]